MSTLNLRRGALALAAFLGLSALAGVLDVPPWPYATPVAAGVSVLVGYAIDEYLDGSDEPDG